MPGATLFAATSFLISVGMACFVSLSGGRSPLRPPLLGLLGAQAVWSLGEICYILASSREGAYAGFQIGWLGIAAFAVSWLLLSARYARIQVFENHPRVVYAIALPHVLCLATLFSNSHHHMFVSEFAKYHIQFGPFYYVQAGLGYFYFLTGIFLHFWVGDRPVLRESPRRIAILTTVLLGILITRIPYDLQISPLSYDITPFVSAIALLVLITMVFQRHLLDMLPLARRDIIDHLSDGVLIADTRGVLLDVNPAAEQLLAAPRRQVRGLRLSAALAGVSTNPQALSDLQRDFEALAPAATLAPVELSATRGRHIEVTAKNIPLAVGDSVGRFAVLHDRTEEHRYERITRHLQRLETVGSLAAGIAHEVNNPLAFLRSNLHYMEQVAQRLEKYRGRLPAEERDDLIELPEIVAECAHGVERIGRIVEDMRRFSHAPSQSLHPVDINAIVTESIRLADLHRSDRIEVHLCLAQGLPSIEGSAQRLSQVFINLLVNAKHAIANYTDARIAVTTRASDDGIEVEVADSGTGVPDEIRHRIFDPFFTTKGPDLGTGLGLAIASTIVQEHGGILILRNSDSGGARFVARFVYDGHVALDHGGKRRPEVGARSEAEPSEARQPE